MKKKNPKSQALSAQKGSVCLPTDDRGRRLTVHTDAKSNIFGENFNFRRILIFGEF